MVFFDPHVHIYPEYDLDGMFSSFVRNAAKFSPKGSHMAMAILLRSFQPSVEGLLRDAGMRLWRINGASNGFLSVTDGNSSISLLPARQIAAKERVEILSFFSDAAIPDGMCARDTIAAIRDRGLLPVFAWGRGKWLFSRGKLVKSLMEEEAAKKPAPLVCDSALRPFFWREPLFSLSEGLGMKKICGSDPLPGKKHECEAGGYATLVDGDMPSSQSEMAEFLLRSKTAPAGRRNPF